MNPDAITNPAAEWSIVATIVADSSLVAEVVGTQLAAEDFIRADCKLLYATAVEMFYGDRTVEPLTVAERAKGVLSGIWEIPEQDVAGALLDRVREREPGSGLMEHVAIVRRLSTARKLLSVASVAIDAIGDGQQTPEEIASTLSTEALAITSGTVARSELLDWMDAGTEYAKYLARLRLAKERGIELSVYTGSPWIDNYTKGIAPTELCFIAGAPGTGKSVLAWKGAEGFAARQMRKPVEHRVATLIVSMEMGLVPSSTRLAQAISGVDGMRLREGDISDGEYRTILREWKARDGLPIHFNYASNFRLSQLRALVVEAIRRHNVGFVVIDHFRQLDPDKPIRDANDRDEVKVRFLKESIAKDLNVAVLCLAHTIKIGRAEGVQARPRMDDLRGSGTIAANADFIGLLYRPAEKLSEDERIALNVSETDAELIWAKARHTAHGTAYFSMDPAMMSLWSR